MLRRTCRVGKYRSLGVEKFLFSRDCTETTFQKFVSRRYFERDEPSLMRRHEDIRTFEGSGRRVSPRRTLLDENRWKYIYIEIAFDETILSCTPSPIEIMILRKFIEIGFGVGNFFRKFCCAF